MKKTIIVFALVMLCGSVFSQLQLQTTTINGSTVILPTFNNLKAIMDAGFSDFSRAMGNYNYLETTDKSGYCAKSIDFDYIIKKETGSTLLIFAPDNNGLVSDFRREIKNRFSNTIPSYQNGFEIYRLQFKEGIKLRIAIHEESGLSTVGMLMDN